MEARREDKKHDIVWFMAEILYGAPVRERIKENLIRRVAELGKQPVLAIVQVGNRPDSNIYISNKIKFGEEVGVRVVLKKFELDTNTQMSTNDTNQERVIEEIQKLNEDENVNGIIVQLPLPEGFDTEKVVRSISKEKDADGLVGSEKEGEVLVTPATARAVMQLLDFYKIDVNAKKATVIGRSRLAGGPIAKSLEQAGAIVTVCHKETTNVPEVCREADILISAAGQPNLVTKDYVKQGQIVIDVGINKITHPLTPSLTKREGEPEKPKLVGDVAFDEVEPIVTNITPVPGGVGPLTVACLFENLLDLC